MIEAEKPFTMIYRYGLVVQWQYVDIRKEVHKVKSIILSKISCNIYYITLLVTLLFDWCSCLKDLIIL